MLHNNLNRQKGFSLMELMIVITIIGILVAVAYPRYQSSIIKGKRTDMMVKMVDISKKIEASKLAKGKYEDVSVSDYETFYPSSSEKLYKVKIVDAGKKLSANWKITATPVASSFMDGDGKLTYDYQGTKCRATTCGYDKEWNKK